MAEIRLSLNVDGENSIDEEFEEFNAKLKTVISKALEGVGEDMRFHLREHVIKDIYEAYEPKEYRRRGSAGLGFFVEAAEVVSGSDSVSIEYKPTGDHSNPNWHTADYDELIRRIETKNPPYFFRAQAKVPERPFWQNFTNEMVDEGQFEYLFALWMLLTGREEFGVLTDGDVQREASDGAY